MMKKCVFKDDIMISQFFILLISTFLFLVLYILNPNDSSLIIFIFPLIGLSILTIFIRNVFQKVCITELGLETRFLNKVYNRILWEEMTAIKYTYGRSMIIISLRDDKIFTITSIISNKLNFKRELYKAMPRSFVDMKINLILSMGGFKSRFKNRTEIYHFLEDSDFISRLGYLEIDEEDQQFINVHYKGNSNELRTLIKKHFHIRFDL
jgi:hypothetical protein